MKFPIGSLRILLRLSLFPDEEPHEAEHALHEDQSDSTQSESESMNTIKF